MAYVILDSCIKDGACVEACPVDCIHPHLGSSGEAEVTQLYIDPVECIDCGACVPVCPVADTIFALEDVPEGREHSIKANADYFKR